MGVEAFKKGDYALAAHHWNGIAKDGNPYAQHNLGLLWEYGLGRTPRNIEQAAAWYMRSAKQGFTPAMLRLANLQKQAGYEEAATSWATLAARWGNDKARGMLSIWGKPIPPADLLEQKIANQRRQDEELGNAIMGALFIGLTASAASRGGGTDLSSAAAIGSLSDGKRSEPMNAPAQCSSDFNCGFGFKCVKELYRTSGVCLREVDAYRVPTLSAPDSGSFGVRTDPGCQFNTDCSGGFRCDSKLKVCVR